MALWLPRFSDGDNSSALHSRAYAIETYFHEMILQVRTLYPFVDSTGGVDVKTVSYFPLLTQLVSLVQRKESVF